LGTGEEVTSNVEIENCKSWKTNNQNRFWVLFVWISCYCCVAFEDLAEASTSFTKPDNKPRAKRSKGKNKQKQHPISPIHSCN